MKTEPEYINDLQVNGFSVLKDGSAVIVIGERDRIPVDRRTDAHDLRSNTRARRFESARNAVAMLTQVQSERES